MSFTLDTPVLQLGPFARPPRNAALSSTAILWPVWTYHVAMPRSTDPDGLNVIQRAVFDLLVAGRTSVGELSDLTHLDRDLVAFVRNELAELGLVDEEGRPRRDASTQDRAFDHADLRTVLQDAATNAVWPRVLTRRATLPSRVGTDGRSDVLEVLMSSRRRDQRWTRPFYVLPPPEARPSTPGIGEMLGAVRRHRAAFGSARNGYPELARADPPPTARRIAAIVDAPTPRFVLLSLFLEGPSEDGSSDWSVWDPTVAAPSSSLRRIVADRAQRHRPLSDLIERMFQVASAPKHVQLGELNELLRADAEAKVSRRLPNAHRIKTRSQFEQLAAVFFSAELADADRAEASRYRAEAAVQAGKFCEQVLQRSLECNPIQRQFLEQLDLGTRHVRALLNDLAAALGFTVPLPPKVTDFKAADMKGKLTGRFLSQREKTYAVLLAAAGDASHPLRHAAREMPSLITDLDRIAEIRNAGAHGGSTALGNDELEEVFAALTSVVDFQMSLEA